MIVAFECESADCYGASLVPGRRWVFEQAQGHQRMFLARRQHTVPHAHARAAADCPKVTASVEEMLIIW